MKINTRSWHYRLWEFTYSLGSRREPAQTSLCAYVQRIIWLTVPIALLWLVALGAAGLFVAVGVIWMLFTGQGYTTPRQIHWAFTSDEKGSLDRLFFRTEGFLIGRFRLYPYRLILPLLATVGLVWALETHPVQTGAVIGTILFLAICAGIGWLIGKARNTDTYRLFSCYLRDKKEQVCPMIEFEHTPSPSDLAAYDRSLRRHHVRADGSTDYADDRAASGEGLD